MKVAVYQNNRFLIHGEIVRFHLTDSALFLELKSCDTEPFQRSIRITDYTRVRPSSVNEDPLPWLFVPEPKELPSDVDPEQMVVAGMLTITTPQQVDMKEEENNEKVK